MIENNVSIYALGGLGEVGKNCYCFETPNSLLIVDCGVLFPGSKYPGIDYLVPSFDHLKNVNKKIKALVITHGHEDHIGGIPFLLNEVNIPIIYAPKLAAALIKKKLEDYHVENRTIIKEYDELDTFNIFDFNVSFFRVTHSIPDSFGVVIETDEGTIATTGDFKIDLTPVGRDIELTKIASIGKNGVDLLLSDSTNAENDGYTPSETNVASSIEEIFTKAKGRLIISTFSSNVSRIQQVISAANKYNRKIVIVGRSMVSVINIARNLGYISLLDQNIIEPEEIRQYKANEILILCTGSQGEPMAALSRIASGVFPDIKIVPGDTVVFSSSAIPGNGILINYVVNELSRAGANVITNSILSDIHSSGHPAKLELTLMLKLMKPKYFMPVHGEQRMLKIHASLAEKVKIPKENIFILNNGESLLLKKHKITRSINIPSGDSFVDGNGITNHVPSLIQDRKALERDGMIGIIIGYDDKNKSLLFEPNIISSGFIYDKRINLRNDILNIVLEIMKLSSEKTVSFSEIKRNIIEQVTTLVKKETMSEPLIVPMILTK